MAINIGDVYFVGYFGNGTTNGTTNSEGFAIIVKNPIAAGEVLNFTDGALQPNGTSFATNEQTISFTVPAGGIAANTVLEFPLNGTMQTTVYANDGAGGRTAFGTMSITGNTGLSNSGDQLFAYQGSLSSANVLAGIDVANNSPVAPGSGTATTTNTTYAPTNGAPFLDFPQGTNNVQIAIDPTKATAAQLTNTANYTQNIATTTDPNASFEAIACFATGTRIRTARGDVAVEQLVVGDMAITPDGRCEPIRWIGQRRLDCRRHREPRIARPVRIAAHAFGPGMPARDLLVSPGHAICVDVAGGVLVPAIALVNGATIVQLDVPAVTYWHIELDAHDIVLAENLASESYIDTGNRCFFVDDGVVDLAARPDASPVTYADYCRPFHSEGPLVDAVRAVLRARADARAWRKAA